MTTPNLQRALRAYCVRQPFRSFLIEFMSGDRLQITHPEAVSLNGDLFVHVAPGVRYRVFDADSVSQVLDLPG